MKLTKLQQASVELTGKNIIVSAGAGTGKTRVLVERYLRHIISGEANVPEILALTFTEKAANEMKARIRTRLHELGLESILRDLELAYISTIHAFAARILREHPLEANIAPDFKVLKSEESEEIKETVLAECLSALCEEDEAVLNLVKLYGESILIESVFKIYDAAKRSGMALRDFIKTKSQFTGDFDENQILSHFEALKEGEHAAKWQSFIAKKKWGWQEVEAYKAWMREFSRKRGKKGDTRWSEIKTGTREYLEIRLEDFCVSYSSAIERLTQLFEESYEKRKLQDGIVDFDDLQFKLVALLKSDKPLCRKICGRYRKQFYEIMVDEFQDTDSLQWELITLLSSGRNIFLVGDYKQSVYGFRGAEPNLFLSLEKDYFEKDYGARLELLENFRTDENLLDSINALFKDLWQEDIFEFKPLLATQSQTHETPVECYKVHLKEDEALDSARMREAHVIAERIQKLHEEGTRYGDIAILFQAMSQVGLFEQALKSRGIPYYAMSSRGFYSQPEVRDTLAYLQFLVNPHLDIPLAASLRSPMFQISNETLLRLSQFAKAEDEVTPLYRALPQIDQIDIIEPGEAKKLRFFNEVTEKMRDLKDRIRVSELIDRLLELTGYELSVLANPQGVRHFSNLKKLISLAREIEQKEFLSLPDFVHSVRRLEAREARESEAQVEAEESGRVVRLLSIHRAKGLEFNVVFVADLARSHRSASSKAILTCPNYGYGLQVKNELTGELERPRSWVVLDEELKEREQAERKRLLYVAATRAKKRLILSGVFKERKSAKESFHEMSSWMDWIHALNLVNAKVTDVKDFSIKKTLKATAEKQQFRDFLNVARERYKDDKLEKSLKKMKKEAKRLIDDIEKREILPARVIDLPVSAYAAYQADPQKYRESYEIGYPDEDFEVKEDSYLRPEEELSASDYGTAVHSILEDLDFMKPEIELDRHIEFHLNKSDDKLKRETKKALSQFFKSDLFKKIQKSKQIKKELPFLINERHGLIHGIIDLLYEDEKGGVHLLDYKTGEGSEEKIESYGYGKQISIYAYAVFRLTGKAPQSGALYFLKNSWQAVYTFDASSLEAFGNELRRTQERLLTSHVQSVKGAYVL